MTPPRHRGAHSATPSTWTAPRVTALGLLAAGAVTGGVLGVRELTADDSPVAAKFHGVVTQFADDGALMCVRRDDAPDSPFCDLFFVAPGTPDIRVGDRVVVTTIATRSDDGRPVSGMLVDPLP